MNGSDYMLTEERFARILNILEEHGSVTVTELMEQLHASESTIRRDLNTLDARGQLLKVHGGAMQKDASSYRTQDDDILLRKELNVEQKVAIARYAAQLITDRDVVYLDAGTTTEPMIDAQMNRNALYITNAIGHARKLSALGCTVYLLGGEFKGTTDAIVGEEAVLSIAKYNFTKGFFGTNGVTKEQGFTTPEVKEALIKRRAMEQTKEAYVLADASKFGEISTVTFGAFTDATILTNQVKQEYRGFSNIKEVEE